MTGTDAGGSNSPPEARRMQAERGSYAAVHGGDSNEARHCAALFEYACHEGNDGMRNMLSGARIAEAQTSERGHRTRRGSPEARQP